MKQLVDKKILNEVIEERSKDSHKGNYGRLLLIGGTYPYGGAIIMAALAAVHSGAGLVTVATDRDNIPALHSHLPEAMAFDVKDKDRLKEQLAKVDIILLGPGLAEDDLGLELLETVLGQVKEQQILILDGGAISLFSKVTLPLPQAQTIFTPHQKEWERLGGLALAEQLDTANQEAVDRFAPGTIVVQKKPGTTLYQSGVVDCYQISAGGPYQATGGMGDTLAGMIAGFAGQFSKTSLFKRVLAATYLHSAIADELSQKAYVVLPTDISRKIPSAMKKVTEE
ncbi:NAD(P)H-hydrate dehydratase [Streptococcus oricebi]|uniref:ADP-dependent (S)-NAD(P)H-hydrate dehydratase n=1 Tax=Streptococcus oricebi TaxID=1547447 RepID=A0ABS5B201_9STRE|nr:NAD(P)H-hydrate dehydratase [Streptococcus oricebi]MBP2622701.1 NAD(P)H-hydrate dehydratase [Streptococcus oricebi]